MFKKILFWSSLIVLAVRMLLLFLINKTNVAYSSFFVQDITDLVFWILTPLAVFFVILYFQSNNRSRKRFEIQLVLSFMLSFSIFVSSSLLVLANGGLIKNDKLYLSLIKEKKIIYRTFGKEVGEGDNFFEYENVFPGLIYLIPVDEKDIGFNEYKLISEKQ